MPSTAWACITAVAISLRYTPRSMLSDAPSADNERYNKASASTRPASRSRRSSVALSGMFRASRRISAVIIWRLFLTRCCNSRRSVSHLAVDLHVDLVQMPSPVGVSTHVLNPLLADLGGEHWTEPVPPESDRLLADIDPSLEKQILD